MNLHNAVHCALHPKRVMHLDYETRSVLDVTDVGAYRYAEDESTSIQCASFSFDDGPVHLWVPLPSLPDSVMQPLVARLKPLQTGTKIYVQVKPPAELVEHIERRGEIRAFNANFERVITNGVPGQKLGLPPIAIDQVVCVKAKSSCMGMPGNLDAVAQALGTYPKDEAGRADMLMLSKPRRMKAKPWWTPEDAPEKFVNMYCYNVDDTRCECGVDAALPDMTASEMEVYQMDQRANDRGIKVDLEAIANIRYIAEDYKRELAARCRQLTVDPDNWLDLGIGPTQREKIVNWVRTHGYPQLGNMKAESVKEYLTDPECPDNCREVLEIYSAYNGKAVTKVYAFEEMVCADGRVRGMFLYHGAGTGRWSSKGVQLQNIFRPVITPEQVDEAIELFKQRDLALIKFAFPDVDPMKVMASCIRGMLIADEGYDLIFPDFAGIESRFNAWLWGEEWKLQAFRDFDAKIGPDIYCISYGQAFNVDPRTIKKGDARRQLGKVIDLFGGYEGGVGAFLTFADTYGVDLDEMAEQVFPLLPDWAREASEWMWNKFGKRSGLSYKTYIACDGIKQLFRASHPKIKAGWKALKEAAALAIRNPGKIYSCANKRILFRMFEFKGRSWLQMQLPSGRKLSYFNPSVDEDDNDAIRYWGIDTRTRQWGETSTYGGMLDNNAVQGGCRDLLVPALLKAEEKEYWPLGSVHDEGIHKVKKGYGSLDELGALYCMLPPWARGLPVATEGHRGYRYRK